MPAPRRGGKRLHSGRATACGARVELPSTHPPHTVGGMSRFDALVFPGQGSQRAGMALDFADAVPASRAVLERASEALGYDMIEVCRGADARLDLTEYTQPAVLAAEIAILEGVRAHHPLAPRLFAGHSLGEYTALVAAGAIPLEVALRLVRTRGRLMQDAVPPGIGKMVALLREQGPGEETRPPLPLDEVRAAAERAGAELANDNSISQVVLSGLSADVDAAVEPFRERERSGHMRIVELATSCPFHSRHMRPIEAEMRRELVAASPHIVPERARVVASNATGGLHAGTLEALVDALVAQIAGTVEWRRNMDLVAAEATSILEIGPDRTLRSFFLARGTTIATVTDLRTMARTFK